MLKSTSAERRARRQSSGSRSSLVTVRPLEHSRSPSRPPQDSPQGSASHKSNHNGSNDSTTSHSQKRTRSHSTKRASVSLHQGPTSQQDYAHDRPQSKKGAQSIASNSSKEHHRRRSSLSTRLGLTSPSMTAITGLNRRTPSPAKKRRPADILVTPAVTTTYPKGASLAPPQALAQGGTFYTLESPMFAPQSIAEAPRTPLLHVGQFDDAMNAVIARGEDPDDVYRAPYNWSPPNSLAHNVEERVQINETIEDNGLRPEMEQKKPHPPPVSSAERGVYTLQDDTSPRRQQKRSRDSDRDKRKNMLANALQRATEAVVLDNNHDFSAALTAYREACDYLSEVANRSSTELDKNKLRNIVSLPLISLDLSDLQSNTACSIYIAHT